MVLRLFLFLTLALVSVGCFETEDEYTLNADGSGKVVHKTYFQPMTSSDPADTDSKTRLRDEVLRVLEKSDGVEAWSDISLERGEDGRMFFRGTAYFPDINKFVLHQNVVLKLKKTNDASGKLVFELDKAKNEERKNQSQSLTDEEATQKIKEERATYQKAKPLFAAMLGNMKHSVVANLPGAAQGQSNTNIVGKKMAVTFDGPKVLALLDKLITDDAFMRKQVLSGQSLVKDGPADESAINEALFGSKEPIRAVLPKHTANFDYKAEVAKAKQSFAAVRKELGIEAIPVVMATPAGEGALKDARVVGIRFVGENGFKELQPYDDVGLALSVLIEFFGSVLQVEGALLSAVADTGANLTPENGWERELSFFRLSETKTTALFQLRIKPPGADVKGYKEITADLTYTIAKSNKRVELGFPELKANAQGSQAQASILSIDRIQNSGGQTIGLNMRVDPEQLVAALLVLPDGKEINLRRQSYGGSREHGYSYFFESSAAIPPNGKIVLEVVDQLQKIKSPLKLENLDLLGRPLSK